MSSLNKGDKLTASELINKHWVKVGYFAGYEIWAEKGTERKCLRYPITKEIILTYFTNQIDLGK